MLLGGMAGFWCVVTTDNLVLALLAAALAGMALATAHAVLSVTYRASQTVSGLALLILGTGLSQYFADSTEPPLATLPPPATFDPLLTSGPADWPIVGPVLFGQDLLVYGSWLLVAVVSLYLFRTRTGLALRAVGEDPASADAAGISVTRTRYVHTMLGGALGGLGGAYVTLALVGQWQNGVTAGTGWIAFALVIVSGWRPGRLLVFAYVFGALNRAGFTLQLIGVGVPSELLATLPYLVTFAALVVMSLRRAAARSAQPSALAVPYSRESR